MSSKLWTKEQDRLLGEAMGCADTTKAPWEMWADVARVVGRTPDACRHRWGKVKPESSAPSGKRAETMTKLEQFIVYARDTCDDYYDADEALKKATTRHERMDAEIAYREAFAGVARVTRQIYLLAAEIEDGKQP